MFSVISVADIINIAIIQFPGSNTERETFMACRRAGLNPVEFLWNDSGENLSEYGGFIIVGGFSYEDRSRSGVIASLEPIMQYIKLESEKGKPVLGICNGAQILVESGLVPGLPEYRLGIALTDNMRIKGGHLLGVGYYNAWANLKMGITPTRCAFTRRLKTGDQMYIPLAHGEGRFMVPKELLSEMNRLNQMVFKYCDDDGNIMNEFPTNPNGSVANLAAVCNPAGNVMAIMPHPERSEKGDGIFSSMREYIEQGCLPTNHTLRFDRPHYDIKKYDPQKDSTEWVIDLIITDNEASSVQSALNRLGFHVEITRQTHWEIVVNGKKDVILDKIKASGELFNSNKEFVSETIRNDKTTSYLVRQKEDIVGRAKLEFLTRRFEIEGISSIQHGVLWNITVNGGNIKVVLKDILDTHIMFNPISHECYQIDRSL